MASRIEVRPRGRLGKVVPELIIFDCDGVLIDSELIGARVEAERFTAAGFPLTSDDVLARFVGISAKDMATMLEAEHGKPVPTGFADGLKVALDQAFAAELVAMPGIQDLLDQLDQPVCVASSSSQTRLRTTLTIVGLYQRLAPRIFSSEQVVRGKPAPDLFWFAAKQVGVTPAACVVIEDSPYGIEAARAAGMTPIGFAGGSHCRPGHADRLHAAGAAAVVERMSALLPRLR